MYDWALCAGLPFLFGAALMLVTFALAMTIDRKAADHGRYKEHAEAKAESATEPLLPQGAHDQGFRDQDEYDQGAGKDAEAKAESATEPPLPQGAYDCGEQGYWS